MKFTFPKVVTIALSTMIADVNEALADLKKDHPELPVEPTPNIFEMVDSFEKSCKGFGVSYKDKELTVTIPDEFLVDYIEYNGKVFKHMLPAIYPMVQAYEKVQKEAEKLALKWGTKHSADEATDSDLL